MGADRDCAALAGPNVEFIYSFSMVLYHLGYSVQVQVRSYANRYQRSAVTGYIKLRKLAHEEMMEAKTARYVHRMEKKFNTDVCVYECPSFFFVISQRPL